VILDNLKVAIIQVRQPLSLPSCQLLRFYTLPTSPIKVLHVSGKLHVTQYMPSELRELNCVSFFITRDWCTLSPKGLKRSGMSMMEDNSRSERMSLSRCYYYTSFLFRTGGITGD
jgi:hypothetical protein